VLDFIDQIIHDIFEIPDAPFPTLIRPKLEIVLYFFQLGFVAHPGLPNKMWWFLIFYY
jgi:hypothetical protein